MSRVIGHVPARTRIIGLTGRAQHGKDTVAAYLVKSHGYVQHSFAAALKDLAYRVNPIIDIDLDGEMLRLVTVVDERGWENAKRLSEVRRFLQYLGTEARHVLGDAVWVNAAMRGARQDLAYGKRVVFSDVRFPNEAEAVRDLGGVVVRVVRPDFDNGVDPLHPSEAYVDDLGHAATLFNDGLIDDLTDRMGDLLFNLNAEDHITERVGG